MVTQQTALAITKDFANEIMKKGVHLRKVILFGSYAQNRQTEFSDIDVALVADEFEGVGFLDIPLFIDALRKHYIIQPKTFSVETYNNKDAFIQEIEKTGLSIEF